MTLQPGDAAELATSVSGPVVAEVVAEPNLAEIVAEPHAAVEASLEPDDASREDRPHPAASWVVRLGRRLGGWIHSWFGLVSLLFFLAVGASLPLVQLISYGYLLEVTGRLARGGKLRDAVPGIGRSAQVGGILLGGWLCLFPARLVSNFWLEAYLIDPTSSQTGMLRAVQMLVIVATVGHILAALICGGRLRYFFWPLVAPVSFAVWLSRRLAGVSLFQWLLRWTVGWLSPALPRELCAAQPIGDWFLPAILWKRIRRGGLIAELRERVWEFATGLQLGRHFWWGLKGFLGTFLWLLVPTGFLVGSTFAEGPAAAFIFLAGLLTAIPVFAGLPFIQAHYAADHRWARFWQPRQVWRTFSRSPLLHWLALVWVLVTALPLFLLKIEDIPGELLWTLSLVFVTFSLLARLVVGVAYRRGRHRTVASRWWWRWPWALLTAPLSMAFVLIFTLTRYVSWHGALSLFENHVFLLPAPFWL